MDIKLDGICNDCGFFVVECTKIIDLDIKENFDKKYYNMNICLNRKCKNHDWHYVKKSEKSNYYKHIDNMENEMRISFKNNEQILNQLNDIVGKNK